MTSRKIAPFVLIAAFLGCGGDPAAFSMPVPVDSAPPMPSTFEEVQLLVDLSPCDILPEDSPHVVGMRAHADGYPRYEAGEFVVDSGMPRRRPDPAVAWALTRRTEFEHEAHDCQRLIIEDQGIRLFGPLVGVLPIASAMNLEDDDFNDPVAVASVYNWGDFKNAPERYVPLGIEDDWNCLWLIDRNGWKGYVSTGASEPCFEQQPPTDTDLYTLDVLRVSHPSGVMAVPPTARWGWEEHLNIPAHTLGVRCGSAWCWVGPPETWTSTDSTVTGNPWTTMPGYYDEQHLAIPGSPDGIVPGPIGRVEPTESFHRAAQDQNDTPDQDRFLAEFKKIGGLPVARLTMPDLPNDIDTPFPYSDRWGGVERPVTIAMRVRSADGQTMSAFVGPQGAMTREIPTDTITGTSHAALGAVRWRWHDTSATASTWNACGLMGKDCCDTQ